MFLLKSTVNTYLYALICSKSQKSGDILSGKALLKKHLAYKLSRNYWINPENNVRAGMSINILLVNYDDKQQAADLITMMQHYASDPMGAEKQLHRKPLKS